LFKSLINYQNKGLLFFSSMATIQLTTFINAPAQRVFDLSRSINLHKISTADTGETAIDGVLNGLISEGQSVTWQARHLFKQRKFTTLISHMQPPLHFIDEMTAGDFKSFKHQHHFKPTNNGTIMIDVLDFKAPYGIIGRLFTRLYLKQYLRQLLQKRNEVIKEYAETKKWISILTPATT
jgi:ligand-binding SRPBCC domain-containing protein